ncbi:hypothetical protein [Companilactobacillus baiquanensis]|uniref:LPXTG cell wall anchor domain-containing protein n=1 Tax=Companilactobacillus baiquanensis TaxID=2486005 RepID=A0ABW1V0Y1_9LACO|nr:hypothetical protein [Companilactobacillus baiquanensis]
MKNKGITYLSTLLLLMGGVGSTISVINNPNVVAAEVSGNTYQSAINLDFNGKPFTMMPVFEGNATITTDGNGTYAQIKLSDMANSSLQSMTIDGIKYTPQNGYINIPVKSDGSSSDATVSVLIPGKDKPNVFPMQVSIADPQSTTEPTPDVDTGTDINIPDIDDGNLITTPETPDTNTVEENTDQTTDTTQSIAYSYQVLQEDPSAGESVAAQFFTNQSTVTPNSDGTYTVSMQMRTPKNFGTDPVEITSINGESINPDVTTSADDSYNYMNYSFNISSLDALNNYIPASLKISVANFGYYATHNVNFKFSQGQGVAPSGTTNLPTTSSTPTLPGFSGSTVSNLPTNTGSLPQTGSKSLPIYIMYAGFITLAVAMAGINSMGKFDK